MSWLKEQNRLTHEFCRGELSHFMHITACAFAALAVIGLVLGWFARDLCSWMSASSCSRWRTWASSRQTGTSAR